MGNEQSNETASSTGRKTKSNPPNNSNAAEVAPMDSRGVLSEETRRRLERQFGPIPPKVKKEKKKETKASMPPKAAKETPDKNGNDLIDQTAALALDNPKGTKATGTPYNPLSDPKITDPVLLRAIRFVLYLDEKEWILVDQLVKEVLGKKGVSRLQRDESLDKFVREGLGSMLTGYKRGYAGEVPKWNNDTRGWEIKKFVGLMYWARKILKEKKPLREVCSVEWTLELSIERAQYMRKTKVLFVTTYTTEGRAIRNYVTKHKEAVGDALNWHEVAPLLYVCEVLPKSNSVKHGSADPNDIPKILAIEVPGDYLLIYRIFENGYDEYESFVHNLKINSCWLEDRERAIHLCNTLQENSENEVPSYVAATAAYTDESKENHSINKGEESTSMFKAPESPFDACAASDAAHAATPKVHAEKTLGDMAGELAPTASIFGNGLTFTKNKPAELKLEEPIPKKTKPMKHPRLKQTGSRVDLTAPCQPETTFDSTTDDTNCASDLADQIIGPVVIPAEVRYAHALMDVGQELSATNGWEWPTETYLYPIEESFNRIPDELPFPYVDEEILNLELPDDDLACLRNNLTPPPRPEDYYLQPPSKHLQSNADRDYKERAQKQGKKGTIRIAQRLDELTSVDTQAGVLGVQLHNSPSAEPLEQMQNLQLDETELGECGYWEFHGFSKTEFVYQDAYGPVAFLLEWMEASEPNLHPAEERVEKTHFNAREIRKRERVDGVVDGVEDLWTVQPGMAMDLDPLGLLYPEASSNGPVPMVGLDYTPTPFAPPAGLGIYGNSSNGFSIEQYARDYFNEPEIPEGMDKATARRERRLKRRQERRDQKKREAEEPPKKGMRMPERKMVFEGVVMKRYIDFEEYQQGRDVGQFMRELRGVVGDDGRWEAEEGLKEPDYEMDVQEGEKEEEEEEEQDKERVVYSDTVVYEGPEKANSLEMMDGEDTMFEMVDKRATTPAAAEDIKIGTLKKWKQKVRKVTSRMSLRS